MSIRPIINSSSKKEQLQKLLPMREESRQRQEKSMVPAIEGSGVEDDTVTLARTGSVLDVRVGTVII